MYGAEYYLILFHAKNIELCNHKCLVLYCECMNVSFLPRRTLHKHHCLISVCANGGLSTRLHECICSQCFCVLSKDWKKEAPLGTTHVWAD